jgi:hypothetical protein
LSLRGIYLELNTTRGIDNMQTIKEKIYLGSDQTINVIFYIHAEEDITVEFRTFSMGEEVDFELASLDAFELDEFSRQYRSKFDRLLAIHVHNIVDEC